MTNVTVNRRLWLTADRDTLVEDGDPRAAYLWAIEGDQVTQEEAERVSYQPKSRRQPPNKMAAPAEDKMDVEQFHTGRGWYEVPGHDGKMRRDDAIAALQEQ